MKRTNKIASQVMKLAHSIKAQFQSFSAALKAAWAKVKTTHEKIIQILPVYLSRYPKNINDILNAFFDDKNPKHGVLMKNLNFAANAAHGFKI